MTQHNKPPTLAELMRDNPEAKAYWSKVVGSIEPYQAETPHCKTCDGLGYVRAALPVGHPQFGQLFPCPGENGRECPVVAHQRRERYDKLNMAAQIPAGYQALTFDNWRELAQYPEYMEGKQDAYGAALAFVAARGDGYHFSMDDAAEMVDLDTPEIDTGKRNSIVYYGAPGLGKTSLAVSIARYLLDNGEAVVYVQLTQFFDALKKTFAEDAAEDEDDVLRRYQQPPVLVIDEFHVDAGKTDWRRGRAYDLINYRYSNQLPTVITTNYSDAQIETAWGEPTAHRMEAMAHWIELTGMELRRREPVRRSR